jgi:hypothetical protein
MLVRSNTDAFILSELVAAERDDRAAKDLLASAFAACRICSLVPMKTAICNPHTVPIQDVIVGTRIRRDLGNIDELARTISEVGLLHPIPIRSDGTLIAGIRQLAACKTLGWERVPVHVVNLEHIVRGEFAENAYRKSFLPTEIYAIWRELEPAERAAAKERQKATRFGSGGGTFPPPSKGKTRDKVAALSERLLF